MEEIAELRKENERLRERIVFLESIVNKGSTGNISAYSAIRMMIVEKVNKEYDLTQFNNFEDWQIKHKRQVKERNIMSDLKWDLKVRRIADFREEHIEKAKQYLENYKIN